ncbi:MAG: hypothetical protein SGBAC_011310 [Bacillariaceae sp.]
MKSLVAARVVTFLLIRAVTATIVEDEQWNLDATSKDEVLGAMRNEELFRPPRRLNQPVNECLDGSDWLNWDSVSNGVNLLRKYFECECTGDLASFFSMKCSMTNHCFFEPTEDSDIVIDRRGLLEKCVTRVGTYDFRVDPDTGIINELTRLAESDEFISGFNVTGTIENVNWIPCSNILVNMYSMNRRDAYETCSERERCESFLSSENYASEQIEYICPVAKFNGLECQALNLAACADFDPLFGILYTKMPDCSNVIPCLTSSCQPYKRVNAAPQRNLFRYPECDATDSFVVDFPSVSPSSTPTTLAPTKMPAVPPSTQLGVNETTDMTPATTPVDDSSGCVLLSSHGLLPSIAAMLLLYSQ